MMLLTLKSISVVFAVLDLKVASVTSAGASHLRSSAVGASYSFFDAMEASEEAVEDHYIGRLLEDGTCVCSNDAAEEKPETIRMYVRGEEFYKVTLAERFSSRAQAYYENTGIKVEVVRAPPEVDWGTELISLAGTAVYDGYYFFPAITSQLVEAGAMSDISSYVGGEQFGWKDVLPYVREQMAVFDGKVRMVPCDVDIQLLYYRKDLFSEHNIKVPRTWDEYSEVAKYFHGMEVPAADGNGTVKLVGSCVDRSTYSYVKHLLIMAVHAPTVVSKGTNQGLMFEATQFIPGLGEAFAETLRHLENQAKYGAEEELDVYMHSESINIRSFLREGNCAMTYYSGDVFAMQYSAISVVGGKVGVSRLPGVTKVYDHLSRKLVNCTVETCPYGEDYRDIGRVNYAPFASGGGMGIVASNLPKSREAAIANFLGFVCGEQESIDDVIPKNLTSDFTLKAKPFRRSHLKVDPWVQNGFPEADAQDYVEALSDGLGSPNVAKDERTPGSFNLKQFIGERVHWHLVRSKTENITHQDRINLASSLELQWFEWIHGFDERRSPETSTLKTLYQKDMNVFFPPKEAKSLSSEAIAGLVVGCSLAAGLLIGATVWFFERRRRNDFAMWVVKPEELHFDDPPVVIGRGSFGCVLLANYRGTQVAVKRVIPPKSATPSVTGSSSSGSPGSILLPLVSPYNGTGDSLHASSPQSMVLAGRLRFVEKNEIKDVAIYRKRKLAFLKEIRYLSKLRHPCITTVMGAVIDPSTEPMLVLEYMQNGSLQDLLHNQTIMLEKETLLSIVRDASQGIRFLHAASPKVIHGDLKSANILVDSKLRAKVADFGLSGEDGKSKAIHGTLFWMAPELLRRECSNNASTDVYSFGIILYEVYSRRYPYEGEDPETVRALVIDKAHNKRPPVPEGCPAAVQSLMADCLEGDPDRRPDFDEIDRRLKRIKVDDPKLETESKDVVNCTGLDSFPRHIAEALRDGREVEAEYHEMVSILVIDLELPFECHPDKVKDLLRRLYGKFNTLAVKYGVFRVDTVGDSYMGVTNLVSDHRDDHAKRMAQFATNALEAASQTLVDTDSPEFGYTSIRCGLHCGPVVADVVGRLPPRYCLVGDTVNTASLLEETSEPGRIHCSDMAFQLMRIQSPDMPLLERGLTLIKGKGEMYTFWLNEESELPTHGRGSTG